MDNSPVHNPDRLPCRCGVQAIAYIPLPTRTSLGQHRLRRQRHHGWRIGGLACAIGNKSSLMNERTPIDRSFVCGWFCDLTRVGVCFC